MRPRGFVSKLPASEPVPREVRAEAVPAPFQELESPRVLPRTKR